MIRRGRLAATVVSGMAAGLAACASSPPPGAGGVPTLTIRSRVIGRAADYVEVTTAHRTVNYRVEQIALVAPDGIRIRPEEVQRERTRSSYGYPSRPYGSVGVGGSTGSYSGVGVGLGIGFPLNLGSPRTGPTTFVTRATIKVPDPAVYRADPNRWKIVVTVGQRNKGQRDITESAPRP